MGWSSVNISMSSQLIAFKTKKPSCKAHSLDGERRWMVLWVWFITASLLPWTYWAVHHLPSGGSRVSVFCNTGGLTGGSGWHQRWDGLAPHRSPARHSPAWWSGRAGGNRRAGSAGRLSAYWLEGCSAGGWLPNLHRYHRREWMKPHWVKMIDMHIALFNWDLRITLIPPFLSGRCSAAAGHALMSDLEGSWCLSDVLLQWGTNHPPERRQMCWGC